jgi:hypothetical protein
MEATTNSLFFHDDNNNHVKQDTTSSSSLRFSRQSTTSSQYTRRSSYSNLDATAEFEGGASVSNEVASVTKNLVGAGVLSLSGGIALYSNDTTY